LKSIRFGDRRQEHIKSKPFPLLSGFVISAPASWELDENDTSHGCCSVFSFKDETENVQLKLETIVGGRFPIVDSELGSLVQKLAYSDATVQSHTKGLTLGPLSNVTRVDFSLEPKDLDSMDRGVLYLAELVDEWFTGTVCISLIFRKKEADISHLDLFERLVASVQLPIDPLDEMDRDFSQHTYENLNLKFGVKYIPHQSTPLICGVTAKIIPTGETRTLLKNPIHVENSGNLSVVRIPIAPEEMEWSIVAYVDQLIQIASTASTQMAVLEKEETMFAGKKGIKFSLRNSEANEQNTNYLTRVDDEWCILHWPSIIGEIGRDKDRITSLVNSFYFL